MKNQLRYDQTSCRLVVEGLPDVSIGQSSGAVGIITGWQLQLAGRSELEGRKDHLLALMQVVQPYARHLISGVARRFGDEASPVLIEPRDRGHKLLLRSSQPGNPSLDLQLDDAELADLVRVLDQLRLDPQLQVPLEVPACQPLRAWELSEREPLRRRLAAPLGGTAAVALAALLTWMLPPPRAPKTAPPSTPAAQSQPAQPAAAEPTNRRPER
ncbi:MAG: DUF4335 domain-containing protein [Prochlorococcaceae cyanobacterium]